MPGKGWLPIGYECHVAGGRGDDQERGGRDSLGIPRLQIFRDFGLFAVLGPAERGALVDGVADVEAGSAFDEETDDFQVTG